MMISYQGEDFTETEFYGREILEEMIHEQLNLIDKEELNHYIHAKKYVQKLIRRGLKRI